MRSRWRASTAPRSTSTRIRAWACTRTGARIYSTTARNEVCTFLLSSAHYWLAEFHVDGLRVDAVASMLYLDYSRKAGEWIPNKHGGRENLDAIEFLRELNVMVHEEFPGALTCAEESTSWPMVSRPAYLGGLGFSMKWNMGWMNDTLVLHASTIRSTGASTITSSPSASCTPTRENFLLPLSHDEVVHGKGSLLDKMPGDAWQEFANLRLLLAYQFAACRARNSISWATNSRRAASGSAGWELDWGLLGIDWHGGVQTMMRDLESPAPRRVRRCTSSTSSRTVSPGSTATMRISRS